MEIIQNLSEKSKMLLVKMIGAADFESENDMDEALMKFTPEERGNLTDLKKKGLVKTCEDDGDYVWVIFQKPALPLYKIIKG